MYRRPDQMYGKEICVEERTMVVIKCFVTKATCILRKRVMQPWICVFLQRHLNPICKAEESSTYFKKKQENV